MPRIKEPPIQPPEPPAQPQCPICMAETDTFFRDYWGEIVGCVACITPVDAWDWRTEHNG